MVTKFSVLTTLEAQAKQLTDYMVECEREARRAADELRKVQVLIADVRDRDRSDFIGRGGRHIVAAMPPLVGFREPEEPPEGAVTIRRKKKSHHKPGPRDYEAERARTAELAEARARGEAAPPRQRALRTDAGKRKGFRAAVEERRQKILAVFKERPVLTAGEVTEALGYTAKVDRASVYNDLLQLRERGDLHQTQMGEPYTMNAKQVTP